MAEIIKKGYITNILEYEVFDQIISVLLENGKKHNLLSLGSRKITSKNGRNLLIGNFNEIHFFSSRTINKIGRLKKTITIHPIKWEVYDYKSFWLLNEYVNLLDFTNEELFKFYSRTIKLLNELKYKDLTIILYILLYVISSNGLIISTPQCFFCYSKNVVGIEITHYYWFCTNDYCKTKNNPILTDFKFIKLFKSLFKSEKLENMFSKTEVHFILNFFKQLINKLLGITFKTLNTLE